MHLGVVSFGVCYQKLRINKACAQLQEGLSGGPNLTGFFIKCTYFS